MESTTSDLQLSPPAQDGSPQLRLDVWEKGNISIVQLEEKLRATARQALADAIMELRLLPASLCIEDIPPGMQIKSPTSMLNPEKVRSQGRTMQWTRVQT